MATIKEKIQKLLALGTSPNENEARAAILKAKELMAKYKLTESDFEVKKDELVHELCEDVSWTTDSGNFWMVDLCKLVTDNYCCAVAWDVRKGSRTHTLVISGFEDDVQLCKSVVKYAVGFISGKTKKLNRDSRISYAIGFVEGLRMAFEMQKDEHPEWALVVVKPQKVSEYEDSLGTKSAKNKKSNFDPLEYLRGQMDGENFNAQKVLAGCQ